MSSMKIDFTDVIFFSNKDRIIVNQAENKEIGSIIKMYDKENKTHQSMRKGAFYGYMDHEKQLKMTVGVKKLGGKSVPGYEYELFDVASQEVFVLKDVKWLIYLYFHMKGNIRGQKFEAYEDWDGKCVLKLNKKKYAQISFDELTFKATIEIIDKVDSFFMNAAFLMLVYCLFRLYSIESKVVEEILDQIT